MMILEMRRKWQKLNEKLLVFLRFSENTRAGWNKAISPHFIPVEVWEWMVRCGRTLPEDVPFGWKLGARLWWFQVVESSGDTVITDMMILTACHQCWRGGMRWDEIELGSRWYRKDICFPFWASLGYVKLLFYFFGGTFFLNVSKL